MGRDGVLLQGRVLRGHSLMRARFTDFDIMPAEKAHDFTADYMVRVPDDQWKYAVSKRHTTMFLQAFVFPCCLDVSFGGGGVLPDPECRLVTSFVLICLLELFSGGHSAWTHVARALSKLDMTVVTALAFDWSDVCVMTNHHKFGAEVVSADLKLDLEWEQWPEKLVVQAESHDFASVLILLMACFGPIISLTLAVGSVHPDHPAWDACVSLSWRKLFQHCVPGELDPAHGYVPAILMYFRHDEGFVAILILDRRNCRWPTLFA